MFSRVIPLVLLVFSLAGCASEIRYGVCQGKSLAQLMEATDLKSLFSDMASELCPLESPALPSGDSATAPLPTCSDPQHRHPRQTVLVTDFVDIPTYLPQQSGLLMGELMRSSLNKVCCYKIVQAEFGKYFKLSENGLISLTRRVNEIKRSEYEQPEAIVGTYNYLNNSKVVLFVRAINTDTGKISKMITRELDYSCAGRLISYQVR